MRNTEIYDLYRDVPREAQRTISAGRLKGFTDINPMWRIRCLTEAFGPAGVGWYTEILKRWTEIGSDGQTAAFCDVALYIKYDGEWSKPILGTGGSMLVASERSGPRTSDEAYKMAYTDALSVACKALGIGADVYWAEGRTKYGSAAPAKDAPADADKGGRSDDPPKGKDLIDQVTLAALRAKMERDCVDETKVCAAYKIESLDQITLKQHDAMIRGWDKVVRSCPARNGGWN